MKEAYWWRWRPQIEAIWLAAPVVFDSQEPLILQENLKYPKCCSITAQQFQSQIITQYGNGYVQAGNLTQNGMIDDLELLHRITC